MTDKLFPIAIFSAHIMNSSERYRVIFRHAFNALN